VTVEIEAAARERQIEAGKFGELSVRENETLRAEIPGGGGSERRARDELGKLARDRERGEGAARGKRAVRWEESRRDSKTSGCGNFATT
jgi:hypothetical protein